VLCRTLVEISSQPLQQQVRTIGRPMVQGKPEALSQISLRDKHSTLSCERTLLAACRPNITSSMASSVCWNAENSRNRRRLTASVERVVPSRVQAVP